MFIFLSIQCNIDNRILFLSRALFKNKVIKYFALDNTLKTFSALSINLQVIFLDYSTNCLINQMSEIERYSVCYHETKINLKNNLIIKSVSLFSHQKCC